MEKKRVILLFVLMFSVFLISFINAQPPFQTSDTGLIIQYPQIDVIKQNHDFRFNIHVYFSTNGTIPSGAVNCTFDLYNSSGQHQIEDVQLITSGSDNYIDVNGVNFTEFNYYTYLIDCNNSVGGFASASFLSSPTGWDVKLPGTILMIFLTTFIFLMFLTSFYFSFRIPYKSTPSDFTEKYFLLKSKYPKLVLIAVTYGLFVWLLNIFVLLSGSYIMLSQFYNFFTFVFFAFFNVSYVFFIVIFIVFAVEIIRDFKFKKKLDELWRGYK